MEWGSEAVQTRKKKLCEKEQGRQPLDLFGLKRNRSVAGSKQQVGLTEMKPRHQNPADSRKKKKKRHSSLYKNPLLSHEHKNVTTDLEPEPE